MTMQSSAVKTFARDTCVGVTATYTPEHNNKIRKLVWTPNTLDPNEQL